jgi:hypothetical protein
MTDPTCFLTFRDAAVPGKSSLTFEAVARWTGDLMYLELTTSNWMGYLKMYGGQLDPKRKHWDWCHVDSLRVNGVEMLDTTRPLTDYLNFTMPCCGIERGQRIRITIRNEDNIQHDMNIRIPLEVADENMTAEDRAAEARAKIPAPRPDVAHYGGRYGHNHGQALPKALPRPTRR